MHVITGTRYYFLKSLISMQRNPYIEVSDTTNNVERLDTAGNIKNNMNKQILLSIS